MCLNNLQELAGVSIRATEPVVQYCETVTIEGPACLAKSANKHNRVYVKASPLSEELCQALEENAISMQMDPAARAARLCEFGLSRDRVRKILSIAGSCMLVDSTVSVPLADIKDNLVAAFNELVFNGPMAGEPMRGVCFDVVDAKMHSDSAHRRGDQIMPAMRRACYAALLTAQPRLVEPVFLVEIQVPDSCVGAICRSLKKRRATIESDVVTEGTPLHVMRAHLPVADSFGFSTELRSETSGQGMQTLLLFAGSWSLSSPCGCCWDCVSFIPPDSGVFDVLPL